jgi:hypothetical protein
MFEGFDLIAPTVKDLNGVIREFLNAIDKPPVIDPVAIWRYDIAYDQPGCRRFSADV